MKKLNFVLMAFVALMMSSCKPTFSDQLDDTEAFITKWEAELQNGPLTDAEKKKFLKESQELDNKSEELKKEAVEPTKEELARSFELSEKILALFVKADVLWVPK